VAGPFYNLLERKLGQRKALASALTCLVLLLIIAVPFFFIAGMIARQALNLYTTVTSMLAKEQLQQTFQTSLGWLTPYLDWVHREMGLSDGEIISHIGELVRQVSNFLYENIAGLIRGFTNLLIGLALVLFVTFYLLMDGAQMAKKALSLSPLPDNMNTQIKEDILHSLRATLKGTVVLALIQGLAGGVGFGIFGVPNAVFWGTVMVFASVVPLVGTALVWAPAGIYLLILGETGPAVGMMIWCLLVGLVCDNILRPRLLGAHTNVHPLLTFFSVVGGLTLFGMVGLILGPLVLAILISLLEVYERYFLGQPELPSDPQAQTNQE
jgi:predicted PurR-regulated permease PerM